MPEPKTVDEKLVEKSLEIHEGSAGLMKFLYAGTVRPGATKPLSWVRSGAEFWPHVVEDTKVWLLKQSAAPPQDHTLTE